MGVRHWLLIPLFSVCAFAQQSVSATSGPAGFRGTAQFGVPPPFGIAAVTGAPYSGEEVGESVQTLADGTRITRKMPGTKVYRDSIGRTRRERPLFPRMTGTGEADADSPVVVEIIDPAARVKYTLDTQNKVAHRQELPESSTGPGFGGARGMQSVVRSGMPVPAPPPAAPDFRAAAAARPDMNNESLGTQIMEGVTVEGNRHTMTWPAGSQGNDRPMTTTSEIWTSPELKVTVLSKMTDPRSGEHTQKLIHISRGEPDGTLFAPPPDYKVVDEKGEFTIKWGSPQQ